MRRFKPEEIQEIIEILKNDGVISVPTDTVYGVCSQVSEASPSNKGVSGDVCRS